MIQAATAIFVYGLTVGTPSVYNVQVQFEGFVPIFGGKEGKANAEFTVKATPLNAEGENTVVESEILEFKAEAFGAVLPLNGNNISQFFPKATAVISPTGNVVQNNAPKVPMPVRVPGLDSQRLPEISYLPIQFSPGESKIGEKFQYERKFGDSAVTYTVKYKGSEGKNAFFDVLLSQNIDSFEDVYNNPTEEKGARYKLKGVMLGSGTGTFNTESRLFDIVKVTTVTNTDVENLKTKKISNRKLTTVLTINRKS